MPSWAAQLFKEHIWAVVAICSVLSHWPRRRVTWFTGVRKECAGQFWVLCSEHMWRVLLCVFWVFALKLALDRDAADCDLVYPLLGADFVDQIYLYAGLAVDNKHETGFIAKEIRWGMLAMPLFVPMLLFGNLNLTFISYSLEMNKIRIQEAQLPDNGAPIHFAGWRYLPCRLVGSVCALPRVAAFRALPRHLGGLYAYTCTYTSLVRYAYTCTYTSLVRYSWVYFT